MNQTTFDPRRHQPAPREFAGRVIMVTGAGGGIGRAVALALAQSGELRRVPIIHDPGAVPASHGVGLAGVYMAWMIVVLLMYYPCREFGRLRETRTDWWVRYL